MIASRFISNKSMKVVGLLKKMVRFEKPPFHISHRPLDLLETVGSKKVWTDERGSFLYSLLDIENRGEGLILHHQPLQCFHAGSKRECGDGSDPVSFVERMIRQNLLIFYEQGRRRIARTIKRCVRNILRQEDSQESLNLFSF
jgi:hypothetical protein